ncbi:MAG TPA: alpha/beta fold hydrolase [Gaiellaceae bacterium]|nr:alpha/beta fold hydrolase [Gaiellaceae bacterium]
MFIEREVFFGSGGLRFAGTLTFPASPVGAPWPAVLLLAGSGPVDRNENWGLLRVDAPPQFAHALAAAGIATLRYDKRGVGKSEGGDWRSAGFFDAVDDAAGARAFLAGRPEIDETRVAAIGHSEGALTAIALAAQSEPLAAIVLLAGSAMPGTEVGHYQLRRMIATLPAPVRSLLGHLRIDLDRRLDASHARVSAGTGDIARIGLRRVNARWQREFLAYDPAVDLGRCRLPILAVTGGKDLQIDPDQLEAISAAAGGLVTISRPPNLTHTLRCQPGRPTLLAYRKELRRPVDPALIAEVVAWTTHALDNAR